MSSAVFPLAPLSAPLTQAARESLAQALRGLLLWQRDLRSWPPFPEAPDATPIISLYAKGALAGCAGVGEGPPAERVFRAFVQALADSRFGGLGPEARAELRCQVSYAHRVTPLELALARETIEVARTVWR